MVLWGSVLFLSITSNKLFLVGLGQAETFFFFSGLCFLGGILFIFTLKETKGLSKEKQQSLYEP